LISLKHINTHISYPLVSDFQYQKTAINNRTKHLFSKHIAQQRQKCRCYKGRELHLSTDCRNCISCNRAEEHQHQLDEEMAVVVKHPVQDTVINIRVDESRHAMLVTAAGVEAFS
jgi:hypothetical protein